MFRHRAILALGLLFLFACVHEALAQPPLEHVDIALALDKSTFMRPELIRLRVTIANNTSRTIRTHSTPVSLYLTKRGVSLANCRFPDCFTADTYWAKQFKPGETRTLKVDLTNLYWNELISSAYDFRRPKNFYQKLAPGEYSLFMQFVLPTNHSVNLTSNVLVIRVE
jgi:hypothetical protein